MHFSQNFIGVEVSVLCSLSVSVSVSVLHRYCLLYFAETHFFNCVLLFTYFVLFQDRLYLLLEMKMYVTTIIVKFVAQMFQIYLSISLMSYY